MACGEHVDGPPLFAASGGIEVSAPGEFHSSESVDDKHRGAAVGAVPVGGSFLRRFFLHVLPKGFVRIRYFGFLANRFRAHCLSLCQQLLASDRPPPSTSSGRQ